MIRLKENFLKRLVLDYTLKPISGFSVEKNGMLYYAEVQAFGDLPAFEISCIDFFDELPDELTYPYIHRELTKKVKEVLHIK